MMTLTAKYHFYAAHRNELLDDKCKNLHGHTYMVKVKLRFDDPKWNDITMLFADVDKVIEPIIKKYDHATLVHTNDAQLAKCVLAYPDVFGKVVLMDTPTSIEALSKRILLQIRDSNLPIKSIQLKETLTKEMDYEYGS